MRWTIVKEKNVKVQSFRVVLNDNGTIGLQLFGVDRKMISELESINPDEARRLSEHFKIAAENAPCVADYKMIRDAI